ncbi:MAG: alpha/beta fold hydrolase [Pirellulales bacterium]|nr:alpha/beta fold hydrolase [Pirellulales bacterium]
MLRRSLLLHGVFTAVILLPGPAGNPPAEAQQATTSEASKLPPPVEVHKEDPARLTTVDGVRLAATYLPGPKSEENGKETVPVILLHDHKGSGKDFGQLAAYLQSQGHAVLVPDLRGHGESTEKLGARAPLDAATMPRLGFVRMVDADMEVLKNFLLKENNEEKVNIEKLCIVGAGMGASVAVNWARLDWIRPPIGNVKQGQDVKGLVLLSPESSTPGLPISAPMRAQPLTVVLADRQLQRALKDGVGLQLGMPVSLDFRREVSVMIVVGGRNSRAVSEAKRLHTMFERFHPDPPPGEKTPEKDLFYGTLDTKLQGTKLLGAKLNLEKHIAQFIQLRLENRAIPWSKRVKDPYARPK